MKKCNGLAKNSGTITEDITQIIRISEGEKKSE